MASASSGDGDQSRYVDANGVPAIEADVHDSGHLPVTTRCADARASTQVLVTVERTSSPSATAHGFLINYRSERRTRTLLDDFSVTMYARKCP